MTFTEKQEYQNGRVKGELTDQGVRPAWQRQCFLPHSRKTHSAVYHFHPPSQTLSMTTVRFQLPRLVV